MGSNPPAGYSAPPPPDYGTAGENKEDRAPPGGYLGERNTGGYGNQGCPPGQGGYGQSGGYGGQGGGYGNNQGGYGNNQWGSNGNQGCPPGQSGGYGGNQGGGYGGNQDGNQDCGPNQGGYGGQGWGSGGRPIEPDPTEPNYSADVWDYIHYAASRADKYPSEMSSRISGCRNLEVRGSTTQYTPLHVAVKFGQCEAVRQLLAAGAHVDCVDILGQTPLQLACCYEVGTDIPRMLLDARANTEIVDKYTWTALFWASYKGRKKITKMLLDHRANRNYRDKRQDRPVDRAQDKKTRHVFD